MELSHPTIQTKIACHICLYILFSFIFHQYLEVLWSIYGKINLSLTAKYFLMDALSSEYLMSTVFITQNKCFDDSILFINYKQRRQNISDSEDNFLMVEVSFQK